MQVNTVEHGLAQMILVREHKSYIWWEKEREAEKLILKVWTIC